MSFVLQKRTFDSILSAGMILLKTIIKFTIRYELVPSAMHNIQEQKSYPQTQHTSSESAMRRNFSIDFALFNIHTRNLENVKRKKKTNVIIRECCDQCACQWSIGHIVFFHFLLVFIRLKAILLTLMLPNE